MVVHSDMCAACADGMYFTLLFHSRGAEDNKEGYPKEMQNDESG